MRYLIKKVKYISDYLKFKRQISDNKQRFLFNWKNRYPCLFDYTKNTDFDRHYLYHTAWAARILSKTQVKKHIDISSDLRFVTLVSAFLPINFYDYRPAKIELKNFFSGQADLTKLPFKDSSIHSLSCMHVVEHIGLGRYGDPLDYNGDLKAVTELKRVTAIKGQILFVVPIGKPLIRFNAHRIYSYAQVTEMFSGFHLKEFALIPDKESQGNLINNATEQQADQQDYGCGCFWFIKVS